MNTTVAGRQFMASAANRDEPEPADPPAPDQGFSAHLYGPEWHAEVARLLAELRPPKPELRVVHG